jgi:hypothetical protein
MDSLLCKNGFNPGWADDLDTAELLKRLNIEVVVMSVR